MSDNNETSNKPSVSESNFNGNVSIVKPVKLTQSDLQEIYRGDGKKKSSKSKSNTPVNYGMFSKLTKK